MITLQISKTLKVQCVIFGLIYLLPLYLVKALHTANIYLVSTLYLQNFQCQTPPASNLLSCPTKRCLGMKHAVRQPAFDSRNTRPFPVKLAKVIINDQSVLCYSRLSTLLAGGRTSASSDESGSEFCSHGFRSAPAEDFDAYLQNVKAQSEAFRSSSK